MFNIELPLPPLFSKIIKAQGLDQFSLGKITEVAAATSANKVGDFTVTNQALYYKGLLWVLVGMLRKKVMEQ